MRLVFLHLHKNRLQFPSPSAKTSTKTISFSKSLKRSSIFSFLINSHFFRKLALYLAFESHSAETPFGGSCVVLALADQMTLQITLSMSFWTTGCKSAMFFGTSLKPLLSADRFEGPAIAL